MQSSSPASSTTNARGRELVAFSFVVVAIFFFLLFPFPI
jgi:hypothetical protein